MVLAAWGEELAMAASVDFREASGSRWLASAYHLAAENAAKRKFWLLTGIRVAVQTAAHLRLQFPPRAGFGGRVIAFSS